MFAGLAIYTANIWGLIFRLRLVAANCGVVFAGLANCCRSFASELHTYTFTGIPFLKQNLG